MKQGDKSVKVHGDEYELGCLLHRGRYAVETETREDPATGEPRLRTIIVDGVEQPLLDDNQEPVVAAFPIYGEDVGFQPDCEACRIGAHNTRQHADMRRIDREQYRADLVNRAATQPEFLELLQDIIREAKQ